MVSGLGASRLFALAAWGVAALVFAAGPQPSHSGNLATGELAPDQRIELPAVELAPPPQTSQSELRLLPASEPRSSSAASLTAVLFLAACLGLGGSSRPCPVRVAGVGVTRRGDPAALRAPPLAA